MDSGPAGFVILDCHAHVGHEARLALHQGGHGLNRGALSQCADVGDIRIRRHLRQRQHRQAPVLAEQFHQPVFGVVHQL